MFLQSEAVLWGEQQVCIKASATLAFFFAFLSRFCDFAILRFCDFFKDYIGLQSKKDLPLFNEMVYPKKKSENRAIFFQEKNANVDSALVVM